jgi:SAM-dependent methyltransferase
MPERDATPLPDAEWLRAREREPRSIERLQAAYRVEHALRDRLLAACPAERGSLYTEVYQTLFASLPDHPQRTRGDANRSERIAGQLALLAPHLHAATTYLEIGCGDATLTQAVAARVALAYGLDVTPDLIDRTAMPGNFRFVQSGGSDIPLPDTSIDLAYSNQLLEHLHPDDAMTQLREVCRVLRPGGVYLCRTPSRVSGPHDVSAYFAYAACGLHLREYDYRSARATFEAAGFGRVRFIVPFRGRMLMPPGAMLCWLESVAMALPATWRRRLMHAGLHRLFGIELLARR